MKIQSINECHCMALRRGARKISEMYDAALAGTGLRSTQFAILATLAGAGQGGQLNVGELAERLELEQSTMGKNLRPLERDGLVTVSVAKTDKRSRAILLTEAGRKKLQAAQLLWAGAQARFEEANGRKRVRRLRLELAEMRVAPAA